MQAPNRNDAVTGGSSSRLSKLGIVLPAPPTPLGAYIEASLTGSLLFLSGMLPIQEQRNKLYSVPESPQ